MIRVFHLIKSLGRGGAEVLLSEGLRFADHERFTYGYGYFLPWKDQVVAALEEQGAEVRCFEATSNAAILASARGVARALEQWEADLLHCHLPLAGVVGRVAGRIARVPVIYTEHNRMERYHPLTRWLNAQTWSWQERSIAVSDEVAASIRAHVGGEAPVEVVLNGVNVDAFQPATANGAPVRSALGIPQDTPVVGTVAVLRAQKALDDWLAAARTLHDWRRDVRFMIVGDGPEREQLESLAEELGLAEVVHFAGLQEDVRPYLAAMDVYLMSSIFEGLPIALLEAMAMERPVVATRVGGIPEVIVPRANGVLCDPRQPEALAFEVRRMLDDARSRQRMGRAARETVVRSFSMERMARQLERCYAEVLERRRVA